MTLAVALNPSTAIIHPPGSFCAKRVFAQNVRNFVTSRIYYEYERGQNIMVISLETIKFALLHILSQFQS